MAQNLRRRRRHPGTRRISGQRHRRKDRGRQVCQGEQDPFFGLCLGMQLAVVEIGRHLAGCDGAHSTEFDENTAYPVIYLIEEWTDRENRVQKRDKYSDLGGHHEAGRISLRAETGQPCPQSLWTGPDLSSATDTDMNSTCSSGTARRLRLQVTGISPDGPLSRSSSSRTTHGFWPASFILSSNQSPSTPTLFSGILSGRPLRTGKSRTDMGKK